MCFFSLLSSLRNPCACTRSLIKPINTKIYSQHQHYAEFEITTATKSSCVGIPPWLDSVTEASQLSILMKYSRFDMPFDYIHWGKLVFFLCCSFWWCRRLVLSQFACEFFTWWNGRKGTPTIRSLLRKWKTVYDLHMQSIRQSCGKASSKTRSHICAHDRRKRGLRITYFDAQYTEGYNMFSHHK